MTGDKDVGGEDAALAALLAAIDADPENPAAYRALGALYRERGHAADAMAAGLTAEALETRSPLALYNIGTGYFMVGQRDKAERWYRLTLRLDPDMVAAHRNLAAILEQRDRLAEARRHQDEAYRRQNLFIEAPAPESARRRVLILSAAGFGNVPIDFIFPKQTTTRINWFVDYARDGQARELPDFDLVFNAVGDPDMARPLPREVARFLKQCDKPVLNLPERVAPTQRHLLPALLGDIEDVVVPPVLRLARDELASPGLGARLEAAGVGFPAILRPIGSHGGKGVRLVEAPAALSSADLGAAEACYVTAYRDYRSPDLYCRKYRMIFVDREPYPYHLAISQHWLVHYFSADMLSPSWKREEERRFLEDSERALGYRAMRAIGEIGRRLDLDFCGIDFSLLPDGRVLVFEANATMLVHLQDSPEAFPYKHEHVPKILGAFETMLASRLGELSR